MAGGDFGAGVDGAGFDGAGADDFCGWDRSADRDGACAPRPPLDERSSLSFATAMAQDNPSTMAVKQVLDMIQSPTFVSEAESSGCLGKTVLVGECCAGIARPWTVAKSASFLGERWFLHPAPLTSN